MKQIKTDMLPVEKLREGYYHFKVFAPEKEEMILHLVTPSERNFAMTKDEWGYFSVEAHADDNAQYYYKPNGENNFPDPASNYQPKGVHGPSQIVDHSAYNWKDKNWKGLPLEEFIIYELHVGTFTSAGTFEAIIPRLDELKEIGINVIELMPVAQFPGQRNWGYDGVFPYAPQNSYGGPFGLKALVDACHEKGIAVILDVVYNHLGPEGNYFSQFGPYFTRRYQTPWGDAINFDGEWSDGVREFFSSNIVYWFEEFHIDALRCDAIHAMYDNGAIHFWELVHGKVKAIEDKFRRRFYLIAESDLNSSKVVKAPENGGYGFDAQWLDDFHHALYVLINPYDQERYYDFFTIQKLAKAYTEGFVHSGQWVGFRKRKHGNYSADISGEKFIAFSLNHDQVGNRADGQRLSALVNFERIKIAAAAVLLSPYIPMLFMGEEYADDAPFYYFVDHSDDALIKAVQQGRENEFKEYGFGPDVPDPQSEKTFLRSKLNWEKRNEKDNRIILEWYKELLGLRIAQAALRNFQKRDVSVETLGENALLLVRQSSNDEEKLLCFFNFGEQAISYKMSQNFIGKKILDSKESKWGNDKESLTGHQKAVSAEEVITIAPLAVVVYSS